ncbi:MAG: ABC transporter permease [Planctomycetes bacterium]|nr:ABC transporter permease [Planctomycetota bacterium]
MSAPRDSLRPIGCAIGVLVAMALAAPLFALDVPFFATIPSGVATSGVGALPAGTSMPWLEALVDVRRFGSAVDRSANVVLLLAVVFVPLLFRMRRSVRAVVAVFAGWLVAGVACAFVGECSRPSRDWVGKVAAAREAGQDVQAWFPPLPYAPSTVDVAHGRERPSARHPLGTDSIGRDVLVRVLYGARTSIATGLLATSIALIVGVLLGAIAGARRGAADAVVLRLIEVTACFPGFLLVMTWVALAEKTSLYAVMTILGLTGWPTIARLVRAEFLRQSELEYRVAATALGAPWWRVILVHLLPNAWSPVLVAAAFSVSGAILAESGLAFLNLGDPTLASWGELLRQGRETGMLHLILAPGFLIFLTVTGMNRLASVLRDRFDPRRSEDVR